MQSVKEKTRAAILRIAERHADPEQSFRSLLRWFGGVLFVYLFFIAVSNVTLPNDGASSANGQRFLGNAYDAAWPERALKFADYGYLQFEYNDALLEHRFRLDRINAFKKLADGEVSKIRSTVFDDRTTAITSAAIIACRIGNVDDKIVPPVLAGSALGKTVERQTESQEEIKCTQQSVGSGLEPSAGAFERADLAALINWFKIADNETDRVSFDDFLDKEKCEDLKAGNATDAKTAVAILAGQACSEAAILNKWRAELLTLNDMLSFGFLRSDGWYWIPHLIFWSIFGLIGNSLAGLMKAVKEQNYNGVLFAFFYPKLILAPLVAIVIVAMVVYGLFDTPIYLSHQPMFLVFAFISGYASEKFNNLLQNTTNSILQTQRFDAAKFEAAMTTKRLASPTPPTLKAKPATTAELAENARAAAEFEISKVVVDQANKEAK